MSENMMPELTLTPDDTAAAAAVEVPSLTLTPEAPEVPKEEEKKIEPVEMDDKLLTEEEKQAVEAFSHKIDIRDTNQVLQYGAAAQKSVASFSENALNNVRSKDMGEIGEDLSRLVVELKGFGEEDEKKGLFGLFKKASNKLETMKAQYSKVEANVDKIAQNLENHQITLLKDVAMFDQMYELNLKYYKELTMYILAGKKRLAEVRSTELEALRKKAEQTGLAEDAQAYNDLVNLCNRFEKKLHDLELTRMVSVQMGPQTRLLQNNDTLMIEKIQSSLVNTIPLWKSQMVLALGMEHSRQATAAQNAVTEMTNDLLKKNADTLKMGTIATAKEAERSIIDIETLQHTNQQLISTLDEVIQIQRDGAQEGDLVVFGQFFTATLLEQVDLLVAVGADQAAHVLHHAQDPAFGDLQEIDGLAHIGQRDLLRRGHHDALGVGYGLEDGHMLVAGPWRGVDEQEVQGPPGHVGKELADGGRLFGTAPQDGLVTILQEGIHGNDRQVLVVHGRDELIFLIHFDGGLQTQQVGHTGAVHVHVQDADLEAAMGQGRGGIDGDGTLAHTAFAAHDKDLVPDVGQAVGNDLVLTRHGRFHAAGTTGIALGRTARRRGTGRTGRHDISFTGYDNRRAHQPWSPTRSTKTAGPKSSLQSRPWRRMMRVRRCVRGRAPTGISMMPSTASCSSRGGGIWGPPAVTMMRSNGAAAGMPSVPSLRCM